MAKQFEAIYEDCVLRPLEPLILPNCERVRVMIAKAGNDDWMDVEFMDSCAEDADPTVTLEDVRKALSKIHGRMVDVVNDVRGK